MLHCSSALLYAAGVWLLCSADAVTCSYVIVCMVLRVLCHSILLFVFALTVVLCVVHGVLVYVWGMMGCVVYVMLDRVLYVRRSVGGVDGVMFRYVRTWYGGVLCFSVDMVYVVLLSLCIV